MNKLNTLIAIVAISTFVSCGTHSHEEGAGSVSESAAMGNQKDTVNAYVCPMRCENSGSSKAGKCIVCEMDLATNPDFPGSENTSIGEEPVGAAEISADSVLSNDAGHEGHDHGKDGSHEGHNH
jgi:hypothetical protein